MLKIAKIIYSDFVKYSSSWKMIAVNKKSTLVNACHFIFQHRLLWAVSCHYIN